VRVLSVPPAAQRDEHALQMVSAWIAEQGFHCTLNIGMWKANGRAEPEAWGILLADMVRHIANAIEEDEGTSAVQTNTAIVQSMLEELQSPTSRATGNFGPGHS